MPPTAIVGVVIFAVSYALISARRLAWLGLDRPAGALLGAVACVVFGVLDPDQAIAAVDGPTLLLLLGVMGMGAFLAVDGLFDALEAKLVVWARTPARLLGLLVWGAGGLAAVITNDAVCVLGAPVVVRLIARQRLPPAPFLLALATAANTGSVATLIGNPQNMLCASLGGLEFRSHLVAMVPVAVVGLTINHALVWALFRRPLAAARLSVDAPASAGPALSSRASVSFAAILACVVAYTLGADLAWTAAAGFVGLMLVHRRDTRELWPRIDWPLLLFFAGLFVLVEGLVATGVPAAALDRFALVPAGARLTEPGAWARLTGIYLLGANLVSNVPFILVIRDAVDGLGLAGGAGEAAAAWRLLAMASTFAGNLTLLGSVANVIVAEAGRELGGLGFFEHLRVGVPLTLLTTAAGAAWLWAIGGTL